MLFKRRSGVKGWHIVYGKGIKYLENGQEKLCKGRVRADEGLVFLN
jgi:hypothetical protein